MPKIALTSQSTSHCSEENGYTEQLDPGSLLFHNTFVGEAPNSVGQGLPTKDSYNMGLFLGLQASSADL